MRKETLVRWCVFVTGLGATSMSLSSGFIWACGSVCLEAPIVWTPSRQVPLVFAAAMTAWWGYLVAHYVIDGTMINRSSHSNVRDGSADEIAELSATQRNLNTRRIGVLFGAAVLVSGMVVGVFYIQRGNHLMTNIGGILFLGGYVIAHQIETGKPL